MSDVFGDLTKDMYDDFMSQAEEGAKISITDGVLCFKNSDELMEKWLRKVYLESRGQQRRRSSYVLVFCR